TYPLRGVLYFLAHPSLWLKVLCPLLFSIAFSLASTVVLFVFALAPQAHGLDIHLPAWLAWIIAVILVLIEICVASILFVAICLPVVADELFDAVVALSTGTAAGQGSCARGCWLGIAHAGVWILYTVFARILVLIVTAPLNLIPGAGTVLFLFLNGYLAGWNQHLHWFDLRNSGFSEGHKFVKQNRAAYMSAGAVMVLLEMIPGVGILFMFTNIVGAALW
ncbi:etoposide-induced protein 2.4-domain-containing protein, partial [Fimicolochytrium jonesii]|uniref:etoposide-induced protein 2.4-domain-containing protein n=1 Tax=Fimicolochytrium jonesii TaxID=1396493 RepID=UPI0022FE0AC8